MSPPLFGGSASAESLVRVISDQSSLGRNGTTAGITPLNVEIGGQALPAMSR
jgi:hypothetical protein